MTPAEAVLYAAEHASSGAAFELALAAGEGLAVSSHCTVHLNDDSEAVSVAPAPASRLYAQLRQLKYGAYSAPLQIKLPLDVALIVLRPDPPAARLTILQEGTKRIAFRYQPESPAP